MNFAPSYQTCVSCKLFRVIDIQAGRRTFYHLERMQPKFRSVPLLQDKLCHSQKTKPEEVKLAVWWESDVNKLHAYILFSKLCYQVRTTKLKTGFGVQKSSRGRNQNIKFLCKKVQKHGEMYNVTCGSW